MIDLPTVLLICFAGMVLALIIVGIFLLADSFLTKGDDDD